jgi:thermitase
MFRRPAGPSFTSGDRRVGREWLAIAAALALAACADQPTSTSGVKPRADVDIDVSSPDYIAPVEVLGDAANGYYIAGEVVVRFKHDEDETDVVKSHGASMGRKMSFSRGHVLQVAKGTEKETVEALSNNPHVEFAELDYLTVITPCEVGNCERPNDPFTGYKWDLHNNGSIINSLGTVLQSTGKVDADIDWLEAFDFLGANFAGTAKIGIIDTGIMPQHVEFANRIVAAMNFATGYPATLTQDRHSHGTHVAGIAAAPGNNGKGVPGVAYGANIKLINAKSCDLYLFPDGTVNASCPSVSTANAIIWATDQGANVLNMSLGGAPNATSGSMAQQTALQYARSKNVLPFCATGNDNFAGIAFPARFPECVAVAATNWDDNRASYSNYGPQTALSAPGGDLHPSNTGYSYILSAALSVSNPLVTDSYSFKAGTSMATPQAAGLAALLYATGMTDDDAVLARMQNTADDLGAPGRDNSFGFGRINVYRAITGLDPNAPPVSVPGGSYTGVEGSAVSFDGSASSDPNGKPITSYAWNFGDGSTGSGAVVSHTYADNGVYTVTLTVTDQSGLTNVHTTSASIANVPPTVGAFAGATIIRGETYSASGAFTDPGADTWTGAANYGDGTGTTTASLLGKNFFLVHTYATSGVFTVTATVTDDDLGAGSNTATVTVLSAAQAAQSLCALAQALTPDALSDTEAHALCTSLNAAAASAGNGNSAAAGNQLGAFINKVQALVNSRRLSAAEANALIAYAQRIIASL